MPQADDEEIALPPPVVSTPVQRHLHGQAAPWQCDQVAAEVPVALVCNGLSHAVMMCTPRDLAELALGFALSEGLIDRAQDCYGIDIVAVDAAASSDWAAAGANECSLPALAVHLEIASSALMRLKERRRNLAGRTGCGLCGIDSLQAHDWLPQPGSAAPPPWLAQIGPPTIFKALAAMTEQQTLNHATGALHAAAYADVHGQLHAIYEDVGRHNALDKLLGARAKALQGGARSDGPAWPQQGFVVMSSRASYELVRKCARLHLPLLATISAPTSLAIRVAEIAGLQLWGLAREPRAVRYTR
ncbi:formate dehydrogenase accessory sulfurtransferase FdhD [Vandammella animalimorsus]|uniref:Sulfur carrier protein FdhD n=2 Tax=Vandammella animalimorsus TaxID=2029117 RepID=A0A3M6RKG2_9BURK|nr:formate dehydrogenase accessory sulfurtransferase FdhD [Vandammella animalimorsus]